MNHDEITRIFRDPPVLETTRLTLRKLLRQDSRDMYDYASRPEVTEYLLWQPHDSESYTRRYLNYLQSRYRAGDFHDWAVVLRENGRMIGTCGFTRFNFEANSAEIGYVLHPDVWGIGVAPEAARILPHPRWRVQAHSRPRGPRAAVARGTAPLVDSAP